MLKEGTFDVTIKEAYVTDCHFKAKDGERNNRNELVSPMYDLVLLVEDAQGNNDTWNGEISNRTGMGNSADKYRWELTLKTLQDIGFNVRTLPELAAQFQPAADRTIFVPNLVGLKCRAVTENRTYKKQDGTEGHAVRIKYLNGINSGRERRMSYDDFMARAAQVSAAPAAPQAPAYQPAAQQTPPPPPPAAMPPWTASPY